MEQSQKYFESQNDKEEICMLVRKHWFMLLPSLMVIGLLYFIGAFSIFLLPALMPEITVGAAYNFYIIVTSLLFLMTTNIFFYVLLIYHLNVGLVTNEHIVEVVQERLFSRKVSQLEMGKIQDVAAHQSGVMQTILNYGDVTIQTAGELPNFIFRKVPDPNKIAQTISKLAVEFGLRHGTRTEVGDVNANVVQGNKEKS